MSEQKTIDAQDVERTINEALEKDPESVSHLLKHSIAINPPLAHHPTIQCREDEYGVPMLRLVGLLNGILLPDYCLVERLTDSCKVAQVTLREVDNFCERCHRFTCLGIDQDCSFAPDHMGWGWDHGRKLCGECLEKVRSHDE